MSRIYNALIEGGDRPFIVSPAGHWTYAEMRHYVQRVAAVLQELPGARLACHLADSSELVAIMLAAHLSGKSLVVFNRDYQQAQLEPLLSELDVDLLIVDKSLDPINSCRQIPLEDFMGMLKPLVSEMTVLPSEDGEIMILTSGTTGVPKCVRYRWADLFDQVGERRLGPDERWLLAYKLNHFAGVQMLAHVIVNLSALVLARSTRVADTVAAMKEFEITHVSSTPTFWRFAMTAFLETKKLPVLQQITLGSEPVSTDLLNDLKRLFPTARIVHIFASTEVGSCISVSDGRAGLPASILTRSSQAAVQFRICGGELEVKTSHGMRQYLNQEKSDPRDAAGWWATGDLVKVDQGRIFFIGRRSETINVGGVKVHPLEVENVVSAVTGVQLARVYGRENPIMGQIVAIEVVVVTGHDRSTVEDAVRDACRVLSRHSRPRSIDIVDTIETSNFKLVRRGAIPK